MGRRERRRESLEPFSCRLGFAFPDYSACDLGSIFYQPGLLAYAAALTDNNRDQGSLAPIAKFGELREYGVRFKILR